MDFSQKLPDTSCVKKGENVHFLCTLSVFGQTFVWPKTVKTRKNYKNSGFIGNCPKPRMTTFFQKGIFGMRDKVAFLLCL